MAIVIKRVETKRDMKNFIDFRTELYKDDPHAVPYLYMDEKDTLSKDKNKAFAFCEAEYYLAYRDDRIVGRIAAIINHKANERWQRRNVRFGYFDFVDDPEVSAALMQQVKDYGKEKGMDHIIGPMGFTDMDREGMVIEGSDMPCTMLANHNYAYYRQHMERMTEFEKDNDWLQLLVTVPEKTPEKFAKIAQMISKRYHLAVHKITKKQLMKDGYGQRFFQILNECYKDLYEFSELDEQQIEGLLNTYIGIADLNLLSFVFDESKGEYSPKTLIGFGVSFPSFSKALRKTKDGRLLPFGWYHLAKTLLFHDTDTVDLMLIGILPEYRAKGANSVIFDDLIRWYNKYHFKHALTLPMMETNDGVLSQWQYLDAKVARRLRSYKAKLN